MKLVLQFAIVIALSIIVSCGNQTTESDKPAETSFLIHAEKDLHDIWALEWIEGMDIDTIEFMKSIPVLELNPRDSSVLGNSGCNQLNGTLVVNKNNSIKLDKLATTRMFCPGMFEAKFLDYLTRTNNYKREDLKLTLLDGNIALLRFKKVD